LLVPLSYSYVLPDFSKKGRASGYTSIVITGTTPDTGELESNDGIQLDDIADSSNGIQLGDITISSDIAIVFAGILEIIYQVRCMLVHGELDPKIEENHEVVKYCYLILHDLMKDFCS